jgi:ATP-dependent RNA helicase RhlE
MPYNKRRPQSGRSTHSVYNSNNHKRRNSRGKQYINPSLFINKAIKSKDEVAYKPTHLFTDFSLNEALKANITKEGYETPTAIQDQTIPLAIEGRDVIGLANTGTGKTAAFLLPMLNKLYTRRTNNSVLIMAPTRELAQQIDSEFKKFSDGMKVYSALCVGGVDETLMSLLAHRDVLRI